MVLSMATMIGVLVDRWNRKLVMIGADLIIAAAGAALAVVALTIDLPAIDVLGALIACITVAMVAIPKQITQGENVKSNFFEEAKEGYRTFRESKGLFALFWIGALYMFVLYSGLQTAPSKYSRISRRSIRKTTDLEKLSKPVVPGRVVK